jgi:hypothetical protein
MASLVVLATSCCRWSEKRYARAALPPVVGLSGKPATGCGRRQSPAGWTIAASIPQGDSPECCKTDSASLSHGLPDAVSLLLQAWNAMAQRWQWFHPTIWERSGMFLAHGGLLLPNGASRESAH